MYFWALTFQYAFLAVFLLIPNYKHDSKLEHYIFIKDINNNKWKTIDLRIVCSCTLCFPQKKKVKKNYKWAMLYQVIINKINKKKTLNSIYTWK